VEPGRVRERGVLNTRDVMCHWKGRGLPLRQVTEGEAVPQSDKTQFNVSVLVVERALIALARS